MVQAVIIPGSNVVLAEEQEEYATLHGKREMIPLQEGSKVMVPSTAVAFQLEVAEIKMLLEGGTLIYRVLGHEFAPMALWVEPAVDPVDMAKPAPIDL